MNEADDKLATLKYEQEHDEAHCLHWLRTNPAKAIQEVWDAIQEPGETPLQEVVLRFAQLGMSHAVLLYASTPTPQPGERG